MAGKEADEKTEEKKGGKGKIIMIAPLVLLLAAAGWYFFLRGDDGPQALPPPVAGEVLTVDPITINLSGGHFLKLGLGLQVVKGAHEAPSDAKALDLAISQFSGKTIAELSTAAGREKNKAELTARVKLAYAPHHEEEESAESTAGSTEEASDEESSHSDEEESHTEEASHGEKSGGHGAVLTAEQAIEAAAALTVQPDVYEVYFTEFVMQ
jgi:flagellar FliL protein